MVFPQDAALEASLDLLDLAGVEAEPVVDFESVLEEDSLEESDAGADFGLRESVA